MDVSKINAKTAHPVQHSSKAMVKEKAEKTDAPKDRVEIGKKNIFSSAGSWVKANIIGETKAAKGGSKKAVKADKDFGDDRIGLYAGIGAAAGGAIGTGVGMATGYKEMSNDKISKVMADHDVNHPKLTGYDHTVSEDGHYETRVTGYETKTSVDENGNTIITKEPITEEHWVTDGYWHRFSPDIEQKVVGHYQTPEFKHSGWFDPLTGGLVGLAAGATVGAGLGAVIGVVDKLVREH
ncbi:MAG: hypothetical protein M1269_05015 [Chloroflexi bacterium]|nr:hypothetical protein [Chloroflexota bacterium]